MRALGLSLLVMSSLALAACGSQQNVGGGNNGKGTPWTTGATGVNVGDYIADYQFPDGWIVDPTSGNMATDANKQPISMAMFYKSPTVRWLLIDQSAGWCVPCQMEQTNLLNYADPSNPTFGGHQIGVLEMLEQNANEANPSVPGPAFTEMWINAFNLNIPVIGDDTMAADNLIAASGGAIYFPTNVIVDTSTMKIVYKLGGDDPTAIKNELCTLAGISPSNCI